MQSHRIPVGRFAPSSTGALHFGSLLTAVASYCSIKKTNGKWLIRIEDTDFQRCHQKNSDDILKTLSAFGLYSDDTVRYQSKYLSFYQEKLYELTKTDNAFFCDCSRKSIKQYLQIHPHLNNNLYPQICNGLNLHNTSPKHIRIRSKNINITFNDLIQGKQTLNPSELTGDMVLQRKDGIINYIFTCALDDIEQGITHIIRGLDLLELTPCQMLIQQQFSDTFNPEYGHLPLAINKNGQKLSKQTKALEIYNQSEKQNSITLQRILNVLQQPHVELDRVDLMLNQAIHNWTLQPLHGLQTVDGIYS